MSLNSPHTLVTLLGGMFSCTCSSASTAYFYFKSYNLSVYIAVSMLLLKSTLRIGSLAKPGVGAPTVTATAYRKLGIAVATAAHHGILARPLTAIPVRRISQGPQGSDQPPVSNKCSAEPSAKPKRQSILDQMGATRTVKIVVIVFISIYATLETIFYAKALYHYFHKKTE